ncbi:MAG: glycosyltransferase family 4 protein [Zestosphaera sp.]|nr:glycosyltransferase family 4 protein [Thermoproteota archaeon]
MKITFVHHFSLSYVGGGEKFLIEVCLLLKKKSWDVEIRAFPIYRNIYNKHIWGLMSGINYIENWFHKVSDTDVVYFIYAPLIWKLVKTDAPKIAGIHAPSLVPELQSPDVFPKSPIKLFKIHGLLSTITYYYFRLFKEEELRRFDAVHIINRAMKFRHPNVYWVPLFIDATQLYRPTKPKSDEPTILFVGRPLFKKGFDLFVKSAKIIRKHTGNVKFLATGVEGTVDGIIKGLGLIRDNMLPDLYSSAWIVIYPSRIDTFGRVILEAMASGTPVITTPILSHIHLNLPVYYASTPDEIAQKALLILHMPEDEYKSLCAISRRSVIEQYDVEKVFPKFEQMLREVAER